MESTLRGRVDGEVQELEKVLEEIESKVAQINQCWVCGNDDLLLELRDWVAGRLLTAKGVQSLLEVTEEGR